MNSMLELFFHKYWSVLFLSSRKQQVPSFLKKLKKNVSSEGENCFYTIQSFFDFTISIDLHNVATSATQNNLDANTQTV